MKMKVEQINQHLRDFKFEIAYKQILEMVEIIISKSNKIEQKELISFLPVLNEAMEVKDVIRLCDIVEYVLLPEYINKMEEEKKDE